MFSGSDNLSLDAKGRIGVPARHRGSLLETDEGRVVATLSPRDRCILLYPSSIWQRVAEGIDSLPSMQRSAARVKQILLGNAMEIDMDKSGRVLLPPSLRQRLQLDKEVVFSGMGKKFEIWEPTLWDKLYEEALADFENLPPEVENIVF